MAVISAATFNRIPHFEQQVQTIATTDLQDIAKLFLQYGIHKDYSVGLLHRHYDLHDGQIMVHQSSIVEQDICRARNMCDFEGSGLVAHSIFLDDKLNFQPFEYEVDAQRPRFDSAFLDSLRDLLLARGLGRIVAVVPSPVARNGEQPILETLLPSVSGMLSASVNRENLSRDVSSTAVTTAWSFQRGCHGDIEILEVKKCVKNAAGIHDVKDED